MSNAHFAHATGGFQNDHFQAQAAFGSFSSSLGGYLNAGLLHRVSGRILELVFVYIEARTNLIST
jgi:hypothetical protein